MEEGDSEERRCGRWRPQNQPRELVPGPLQTEDGAKQDLHFPERAPQIPGKEMLRTV